MVLQLESGLMQVIAFALIAAALWAFVDALTRRADAYDAAGKLTKQGWLLILGIALAVEVFPVIGSIGYFAGAVATLVYLLDVRPALVALTRRG